MHTLKIITVLIVFFNTGNLMAQRSNVDSLKSMSYIQNAFVKVGIDLNLGGAITYIADAKKQENMINNTDWGRQVQMSFYSGPVPYEPDGKKADKAWTFIGWNPIQSGDVSGNRSKVLDYKNNGKELYVKCIPMHWPLNNVPGECTYECWISLDGNAIKVHSRMVNNRPDTTHYDARGQELPAVYTNAPYHRLVTYKGNRPYTNDTTTVIKNHNLPTTKNIQWASWQATERWAANLNENDYGLGVWNAGTQSFSGGYFGDSTFVGNSKDVATGYIAPNTTDILDYNITYDYNYTLIVGTLTEIRGYVYKNTTQPKLPAYSFAKNRQQWYYANAKDAGWPIKNALIIYPQKNATMISPIEFWQAADGGKVVVKGAWPKGIKQATIYWQPFDAKDFEDQYSKAFAVNDDGEMHTYTIDLATSENYNGKLKQLKILLNADNVETSAYNPIIITSVEVTK